MSRRPTLALAQLAIAREHGFASWARLAAEVERRTQSIGERADAFVAAVATNRPNRAARLLQQTPAVVTHDVFTAAAAGDPVSVNRFVASDRALATARDAQHGLTPLLYAASTRLGDPHAVTALLLDHGASATDPQLLSHAIWRDCGAEVVRLLLEQGVDPNAPADTAVHQRRKRWPAGWDLSVAPGGPQGPSPGRRPAARARRNRRREPQR